MLLLKIGQNALTTLLHSADDYEPRYLPSLLKPVPIINLGREKQVTVKGLAQHAQEHNTYPQGVNSRHWDQESGALPAELRAPTAHSWFGDIPSKSQTPVLGKMWLKLSSLGQIMPHRIALACVSLGATYYLMPKWHLPEWWKEEQTFVYCDSWMPNHTVPAQPLSTAFPKVTDDTLAFWASFVMCGVLHYRS